MIQGTVGIVLTCVDCRLHPEEQKMYSQFKDLLQVDHVFVRTAAGPDGRILAQNHHCQSAVEDMQLLIDAKGASVIGVVAHYDCAGHSVPDEQHDRDVSEAAKILQDQLQFNGSVKPLIAIPQGDQWVVQEVILEKAEVAA